MRAFQRHLGESEVVAREQLSRHVHGGADHSRDHWVPAGCLVVGHEKDRLAAARNLHRAGREPERKQLVA
jgi:hypothetical protein